MDASQSPSVTQSAYVEVLVGAVLAVLSNAATRFDPHRGELHARPDEFGVGPGERAAVAAFRTPS